MAHATNPNKNDKRHRKLTKSLQIASETLQSMTVQSSSTPSSSSSWSLLSMAGAAASDASDFPPKSGAERTVSLQLAQQSHDEQSDASACQSGSAAPVAAAKSPTTAAHWPVKKPVVQQKSSEERRSFAVMMASPSSQSHHDYSISPLYAFEPSPQNAENQSLQQQQPQQQPQQASNISSCYITAPVTIPTCCLRSQMNQKQQNQSPNVQQQQQQQPPSPVTNPPSLSASAPQKISIFTQTLSQTLSNAIKSVEVINVYRFIILSMTLAIRFWPTIELLSFPFIVFLSAVDTLVSLIISASPATPFRSLICRSRFMIS